ncbi:MAG: hypothetical protein HYY78_17485 [Betaproteobacteria bacterium]|nr:hypothetical protein [Betaproteobacteria bacterium]
METPTRGPAEPIGSEGHDLNAILVEYETLHSMQRQIYEAYVKCLVLIIIAIGAIGGVLINAQDIDANIVAMLAIVFTLLIDSWAAGWAYLHIELWAHRKYLATLEILLRRRIATDGRGAPFSFYSGTLAGVYAVGLLGNRFRCHKVLDFCVVFSCMVIYLLSLWFASTKGFDVVSTLDLVPLEARPVVDKLGRWVFAVISLGVLLLAVWAWARVAMFNDDHNVTP